MARPREEHIEHLLRRAGFGASRGGRCPVCRHALRRGRRSSGELRPDPRRRRQQDRSTWLRRGDGASGQRIPAAHQHRRRAAALVVPHGPQSASAAGEDDAVLAQPLRDRLVEDQRQPQYPRSQSHDGGKARRGRAGRDRPDRAAASACARQLQGHAGRHRQGSGDAGLARWPAERPRPAAGELRARADGAVHDGRRRRSPRPTSTPVRASSPAGICPARATRITPSSTTRDRTTSMRRSSRSRSIPTATG